MFGPFGIVSSISTSNGEKDRSLHFLRKRSRNEIRLSPPLSLSLFGLAIRSSNEASHFWSQRKSPDCFLLSSYVVSSKRVFSFRLSVMGLFKRAFLDKLNVYSKINLLSSHRLAKIYRFGERWERRVISECELVMKTDVSVFSSVCDRNLFHFSRPVLPGSWTIKIPKFSLPLGSFEAKTLIIIANLSHPRRLRYEIWAALAFPKCHSNFVVESIDLWRQLFWQSKILDVYAHGRGTAIREETVSTPHFRPLFIFWSNFQKVSQSELKCRRIYLNC